MKLSEPPATIAAGTALPLDFVNDGGKDGNYTLELTLKDELGKVMLTHTDTQAIAAGATYHLDLSLSDGLKSGKYILKQDVSETLSGKSFNLQSGITLSGLTATLNAYTLKEKYFDNEIVAGKAEIAAGGNITYGTLKARIIKSNRGGITVYEANHFQDYSQAYVMYGRSFADKTYMVTNLGLVEYDRSTGKYNKALESEYLDVIYITASGEVWLATWNAGVFCRNLFGEWTNFTTADGLISNDIWSFIERNKDGQKAIWMATEAGIAVFNNGAWSSYTTADGLSSNNVYEFAKDSNGEIWVWSEGGIDRFNGSSFVKVETPFDTGEGNYMRYSANGDIWMDFNVYDSIQSTYKCYIWRFSKGSWNNWDMTAISPGLSNLGEFNEDDGVMWFSANNYNNDTGYWESVLIKYDGTFTFYNSTDIPEIEYTGNVIPVPGWEGLYFGSYPGFVEFAEGQWQQHLIEMDKDTLFLDDAFLLASDGQGGVWAAANGGLSHFKNGTFTNYKPEVEDDWSTRSIAVGPDGTVYAANANSVLKIDQSGISKISYPWEYDSSGNQPVIGVDDTGHLWLAENACGEGCSGRVFYYNGEWNTLLNSGGNEFFVYVNKIISDGSGGVWIALKSEIWSTYARLIHVKNDFSIQEYTPGNSELAYHSVEDIYLDTSGILWILSKKKTEYYCSPATQHFRNLCRL